jgi:hypothetical protein
MRYHDQITQLTGEIIRLASRSSLDIISSEDFEALDGYNHQLALAIDRLRAFTASAAALDAADHGVRIKSRAYEWALHQSDVYSSTSWRAGRIAVDALMAAVLAYRLWFSSAWMVFAIALFVTVSATYGVYRIRRGNALHGIALDHDMALLDAYAHRDQVRDRIEAGESVDDPTADT